MTIGAAGKPATQGRLSIFEDSRPKRNQPAHAGSEWRSGLRSLWKPKGLRGVGLRYPQIPMEMAMVATSVDDRRETVSLIGSDKVDGTAVYGADGNKIGSVQRVMI